MTRSTPVASGIEASVIVLLVICSIRLLAVQPSRMSPSSWRPTPTAPPRSIEPPSVSSPRDMIRIAIELPYWCAQLNHSSPLWRTLLLTNSTPYRRSTHASVQPDHEERLRGATKVRRRKHVRCHGNQDHGEWRYSSSLSNRKAPGWSHRETI